VNAACIAATANARRVSAIGCKQPKILLAKYRVSLNSPKRSIYYEGRCLRHVSDAWAGKMGGDGEGRKREERVVEAYLFFDPRRHADQAARLDEKAFTIEHKAASETFEDVASARRWLRENARWLAPCLGAEKGADGAVVVRRRPRSIAARTAKAGIGPRSSSTCSRTRTDSGASGPACNPWRKGACSLPSSRSPSAPNSRTACAMAVC
jgi:hypothetical protein